MIALRRRPPWWFCCGWWSPWCVIDTALHMISTRTQALDEVPTVSWVCDRHDAALERHMLVGEADHAAQDQ